MAGMKSLAMSGEYKIVIDARLATVDRATAEKAIRLAEESAKQSLKGKIKLLMPGGGVLEYWYGQCGICL